jgi:hypothetical protein
MSDKTKDTSAEDKTYGRKGNHRGKIIGNQEARDLSEAFCTKFVDTGETKVYAKAYSIELIMNALGYKRNIFGRWKCKRKIEASGMRIYFGLKENTNQGNWEIHPILVGYELIDKKHPQWDSVAEKFFEDTGNYQTIDFYPVKPR